MSANCWNFYNFRMKVPPTLALDEGLGRVALALVRLIVPEIWQKTIRIYFKTMTLKSLKTAQ